MNLPGCSWSVYDFAWIAGPFDGDTQDQENKAKNYCGLNENDEIEEEIWENDCID